MGYFTLSYPKPLYPNLILGIYDIFVLNYYRLLYPMLFYYYNLFLIIIHYFTLGCYRLFPIIINYSALSYFCLL